MMHFFRFVLILIVLTAHANGLPMRNKGKHKSTYVGVNSDLIDNHESLENEKLAKANAIRQKHKTEKNSKSYINPARYYHQIREHKANKEVTAHTRNLAQLNAAEKTGYARITKSKSGKKDHITAIDWDTYNEHESQSP